MQVKKEFELFAGEIIRKCPIEHFTAKQFLYGSPYSYIIKYAECAGGSPEKRYGLWKFDNETLKYSLFQTAGEKNYAALDDIARQWEKTMRDDRHIKTLQTMPRSFWSDRDKIDYAHIETIDE